MFLQALIILGLILVNGLLAMAEIAVVSARKARLQQRAEAGDERARLALELANDPGDFLSTVQIGITLVGVLAGAFGGATIAGQIAAWLEGFPALARYAEAIAVTTVVLAITYFSLVLGELAPKRLALNNAEGVAAIVAGPMRLLSRVTMPLVRLLSASTHLVLRLAGVRPSDEPPVTEEEIRVLIDQGTQAGVFEEAEQDMVEAVFRLGDRRVDTLMTPRTEIYWLDLEDTAEENRRKLIEAPHGRLPVAWGNLDEVAGIVQSRDLLAQALSGEALNIEAAMIAPLFLPESMQTLKVLDLFRDTRQHIAIVIDEFGGVQGLVTAFDILESIVGDIPSLDRGDEPGITARDDGSWLVDGRLQVDEFKEVLGIASLPGDDQGYFQTMGGFMMTTLGRVPEPADRVEWGGYRFEVVDMDGMRVDKLLISRLGEEGTPRD